MNDSLMQPGAPATTGSSDPTDDDGISLDIENIDQEQAQEAIGVALENMGGIGDDPSTAVPGAEETSVAVSGAGMEEQVALNMEGAEESTNVISAAPVAPRTAVPGQPIAPVAAQLAARGVAPKQKGETEQEAARAKRDVIAAGISVSPEMLETASRRAVQLEAARTDSNSDASLAPLHHASHPPTSSNKERLGTMARKVRLIPGQCPILPAKKKRLHYPQATEELIKGGRKKNRSRSKADVTAYLGTAFFRAAEGERGYWGALINDPRRTAGKRIRETYGSCDADHDYEAAILATSELIASIARIEGVGRSLKLYAPRHIVDEMYKWETGLRLKSRWCGLQQQCIAYGPIDFRYPSEFAGNLTGPRLRRAKQLAHEAAAEWGGVTPTERRDDPWGRCDNEI